MDNFIPIPARRFNPDGRGEAIPGRVAPKTAPAGAEARGPPILGLPRFVGGDWPPSLFTEGLELRELREAWNYRQRCQTHPTGRDSQKAPGDITTNEGTIEGKGMFGGRGCTAIILACIPAGSLLTPPANPLPADPELEGGLAPNPLADLAAWTEAKGEVLPLD